MWRRSFSRFASITANVVLARGKCARGLINTSVRPSAESPLGEPSYATAGTEKLPFRRRLRSTRPRATVRSRSSVSGFARAVTYSSLPPKVDSGRASTPTAGRPSAAAGAGSTARIARDAGTRSSARAVMPGIRRARGARSGDAAAKPGYAAIAPPAGSSKLLATSERISSIASVAGER